jgi:hypothetical protein
MLTSLIRRLRSYVWTTRNRTRHPLPFSPKHRGPRSGAPTPLVGRGPRSGGADPVVGRGTGIGGCRPPLVVRGPRSGGADPVVGRGPRSGGADPPRREGPRTASYQVHLARGLPPSMRSTVTVNLSPLASDTFWAPSTPPVLLAAGDGPWQSKAHSRRQVPAAGTPRSRRG